MGVYRLFTDCGAGFLYRAEANSKMKNSMRFGGFVPKGTRLPACASNYQQECLRTHA